MDVLRRRGRIDLHGGRTDRAEFGSKEGDLLCRLSAIDPKIDSCIGRRLGISCDQSLKP